MSSIVYEDTLQKEVCVEYGAAISGAFYRYANENGIDLDDKANPISSAKSEASILTRKLYGATNGQVQEIKDKLDNLKAYLFTVNPNAVI